MWGVVGLALPLLFSLTPASAEQGFDLKYERDYNIFNPINQYRPDNPCARNCRWKLSIRAWSARESFVPGNSSSQIASSFNRRSPSIHCNGTEKFPPPSRYFAAKPHPRKIVIQILISDL